MKRKARKLYANELVRLREREKYLLKREAYLLDLVDRRQIVIDALIQRVADLVQE